MSRIHRIRPCIERLESRDVPAVVIVNPTTATYTDIDGDHVTIKVSSGTLTAGLFTTAATGKGDQLQLIDFSGGGFDGASLTFSVAKASGGDGLANVGYINSTGHDLGAVAVKGDLGRVNAGTGIATVPSIKSLTVRSMGRLGLDTQGGAGDLKSNINGALGSLKVTGDVKDAFINVRRTIGMLGSVTVGGSLIGGSNSGSGEIFSSGDMGAVKIGHDVQGGSGVGSGFIESDGNLAGVTLGGALIGGSGGSSGGIITTSGDMGAVKIGHDVRGGSGSNSGLIQSNGKLAGVTLGGALIGGSGGNSGQVFSTGDMGAVKIAHDVQGGSGFNSGLVIVGGKLAGVSIGGSLIGGSNSLSGAIITSGDMGPVKIGHDLTGGNITGSAALDRSGVIESFGRIASVTIGGSIMSGIDNSSGALTFNATIRAANDIGSLAVKGSLIGNVTANGASPVIISARGQAVQGATTDLAIGRISIGGRVEYANILAGYDTGLNPLNGDAQIGAVKVVGDWIASNLVAGTKNSGNSSTAFTHFGDGNDVSIGAGSASIIATIASVTIAGQVFGTPASVSATDHFGFVSQQIGSLKIGGSAIALKPGPHNDNLNVGETTDVTVHEV